MICVCVGLVAGFVPMSSQSKEEAAQLCAAVGSCRLLHAQDDSCLEGNTGPNRQGPTDARTLEGRRDPYQGGSVPRCRRIIHITCRCVFFSCSSSVVLACLRRFVGAGRIF